MTGDCGNGAAVDEWYLGQKYSFGDSINGSVEFTVCELASIDWWMNYDKDSPSSGTFKIFVNGTLVADYTLTINNPANPAATLTGNLVLDPQCENTIRVEGTLPSSEDGEQFMLFKITGAVSN